MRFNITTERKRTASIAPTDSHGRRLRRLILPGLLALVAFSLLVSLGNWQVRRLAWKEDLIARVAERPSAAPIDFRGENLADVGEAASFLERNEYRTAILAGDYSPTGEVLVFTSLEDSKGAFGGPGYWVLTPFLAVPDRDLVYVNRGFVPDDRKAAYATPPSGRVTVQGLIRAPEEGSWLTPEPDLAHRIFYARDLQRIARTTGSTSRPASFFVDLEASATPPSGVPQAGETRMTFTNNHLQYAVTWYGLAAALLAVFAAFCVRTIRGGDEKPA